MKELSDKEIREIVIKKLNEVMKNREAQNRAEASRMCYNYFQVRDILKSAMQK